MVFRVLLAEDQVVAELARGDELVAAALAARPDVAVVDIEMPGQDGISAASELRHTLPSCRTTLIAGEDHQGDAETAMSSARS